MTQQHYYFYDSETGEFTTRTSKPYPHTDDPYIIKPKGWNWHEHVVNLDTLEPEPKS